MPGETSSAYSHMGLEIYERNRKLPQQITYLGFAGHGNLGDDAIRDVYERRLPEHRLWNMPVRKADIAKSALSGRLLRHRGAPLLLGGGTVLGRTIWRHHIKRTVEWMSPSTAVLLGAGVEDPEFVGDRSYTSAEELSRWPLILDQFESVTVRGPRSQELLAGVGVAAELVGDPALLLGRGQLSDAVDENGPVLVNLTHGEDQWGGTALDWSGPVIEYLRRLIHDGRRVEFVSMEADDVAINDRARRELADTTLRHHRPETTDDLLALLGGARLVIGTRLHMCVLGVAAGVPTLSLEYRPKCRDFMASVNAERYCLRVDQLERDLVEAVGDELLAKSREQLALQNARVEHLRSKLRDEFVELEKAL
ncbi:polysaccharide pyruvyl transferase family protein [Microbacterium sp. SGAir0570]|uniref:polysaccharide pyruvyl transferase family protein n=1 Tax=Microbacterium sp. SGAir0570 TaxID=2070348 RepID=UPI0015E8362B|nr:polysaccharide pyruvyl transferase family protein [Microbacterium sp. SGAir0570]